MENNLKIKNKIEKYLKRYRSLSQRIIWQLILSMHTRGDKTIESIYSQARKELKIKKELGLNLNIETAHRLSKREIKKITSLTIDYSSSCFTEEEIDDLVNLVRKKEEAKNLKDVASMQAVTFDSLAKAVKQFCKLPVGQTLLQPSEVIGIRVALVRHLISDQLNFLGVAKDNIKIRDLESVIDNAIGPPKGMGRIGGKSAGMLLAYRILAGRESNLLKNYKLNITIPESYYLRSDLYRAFIKENGFRNFYDQKYKSFEEIKKEYPFIKELFKNGSFPKAIVKQFVQLLKKVGDAPLIVRSSSLLEDSFGASFSGKYKSIFLGNQGTLKQKLQALMDAIAEVYSSVLSPDPIFYRKEMNLLDYDEMMAILIQKVVGFKYGDYYLPLCSGVAFSKNEYKWNPRLKKEDGMVRIVMGLGTRAVDRVGGDYPRIVGLTIPSLRPEIAAKDIRKYSQKYIDVINLKKNSMETITLSELLSDAPFPSLDQVISNFSQDHISTPIGSILENQPENYLITFDKLTNQTSFFFDVKNILDTLENTYKTPVDIEFAYDGVNFYILQCRPMARRIAMERVMIPHDIPEEKKIFSAQRDIPTAFIKDIDYIVYIDPMKYNEIGSIERKLMLGQIVGRLNQLLKDQKFILMGPGRWGSNDINLGIRVSYADINKTKILIEIARKIGDYIPEVSFGTHFFQDLVESGIYHMPLYPDEPGNIFNEQFLNNAPNELVRLLPEYHDYSDYIKVINIPNFSQGKKLHIIMDGVEDKALGYLN